ncbi:MAG: PQQ-dependent sugar dehydrogenase [Pirellulales bacterium]
MRPLATPSLAAIAIIVTYSALVAAQDDAARQQYADYALTHDGDFHRGQKLFHNEQLTKCSVCHRVGQRGEKIGPDLSAIGGKFDRAHLIESLLEPSRQIVEGYRTSVIVTTDGRIVTGVVTSQSQSEIAIADQEGNPQVIAIADIAERKDSDVSLMPQRLYEQLTAEQFTDLIAYLETLRGDVKATPGSTVVGGIQLPDGFQVMMVATGLTGCTALETAPDGRMFVCEQVGRLRVVKDGRLLERPFVTLPVDSSWERGLIGVTLDPEFPREPYVYVCYVAKEPYPHHRISRFTAEGDVARPDSERVLLSGDDQRKLGGNVPAGHQGGALHFGPDGKLYVGIGEQTAETPAQRLDTFQGKILRISRDGSVPDDNPLLKETSGKYLAIWARGLRNPFTFAFDGQSGMMLINDVGGQYEEINCGIAGANYGWPSVEHGPTEEDSFVGPVHFYPQASISGGDFAPADLDWPEKYRGKYFFADYVHGWIKTLDPRRPEQAEVFAGRLRRPVDLRFAPDGSLYVLLRNAWVIDGKFLEQTGTLLQVRWQASDGT